MDKAEALERYLKRKEIEYNSMEKDELISELLKNVKEAEDKADRIRNNQKDEILKELVSDEELKQILKENLKNAIIERSKDSHFVDMLFLIIKIDQKKFYWISLKILLIKNIHLLKNSKAALLIA